jgi:hypothetical protein
VRFPKPEKRGRKPRQRIARGSRPRFRLAIRFGTHREKVKFADNIWREIIRAKERAGICPCCLKRRWAHCAHGWPKGYYPWMRFEVDNGIPLCWPCHRRVDADAHAKEELWRRYIGTERYERLKLMAQVHSKLDMDLVIMSLEAERGNLRPTV